MKIYFFIVLIFFLSFNCIPKKIINSDDKYSTLLEENSHLNKFIENEDWEEIYNKLMDTKKMNIIQTELPSKRIFIREHNENYPPPSLGGLSLEFLSYRSMDDTTMTINLIKTRLKINIPGYKADTLAVDTSYHFWKFYFNKWYLLDFERREIEDDAVTK